MLEKNKDYVEMRVSSTDCAFTQNEPTSICIDGYVYTPYMRLPDPGEFYILISKEKFEKMQADVNINAEIAKQWEINYDLLLKKTGFDTVEELVNYLDSEAECDTLREDISKLKDQVKYTCDEWYSANSRNNSWKAAAECNSPKELIEKREALQTENKQLKKKLEEFSPYLPGYEEFLTALYPEATEETIKKLILVSKHAFGVGDLRHTLQTDLEYYRTLSSIQAKSIHSWKENTGCPSPLAAKTLIESGMSYEYAYHEAQKENRKLTEEVDSWKNVTGYSIPEDYMHARISGAFHTPFDYTAAWQKATGCNSPDEAKQRIEALNERIDESEADYNHLLCITGFESEGEIEDALDKCYHSTLRKALVYYEFDYEELLKLTGYKSTHDIRVLLRGDKRQYYHMRDLINSLKRNSEFSEVNWKAATGCDTPGRAEEKLEYYKDRLGKALNAANSAKNYLDTITL